MNGDLHYLWIYVAALICIFKKRKFEPQPATQILEFELRIEKQTIVFTESLETMKMFRWRIQSNSTLEKELTAWVIIISMLNPQES